MNSSTKPIAAFVLVLLVCIAALSLWSEGKSGIDRKWIEHTHLVIENLQAIRIDITRVQNAQRNFLLTGQDTYLQTYGKGLVRLSKDIQAVRELTSDNPGRQQAIAELQPLISGHLAVLAGGITFRKQNGASAIEALINENQDEALIAMIGAKITGMRRTEQQLLTKRLIVAGTSTQMVRIAVISANALAILILLVAARTIDRESSRRNQAESNLKQLNEQLERRSAELSDANVELEGFAYSIAHDLRSPLRHIAGYSDMLAQDYGARLDAEGLRCLQKIDNGARMMGNLVDDLLHLSKVGQRDLAIQNTPLGSLLEEAIKGLELECSDRRVEWQIGTLYIAECDPGLVKQVFVNLISNAVKYTRTRECAVIEVGMARHNDERVVFVRDNGVGFEMKYATKLFGVFQRLHKARDFEGTGVGLAIVQRIIRKHGGRIWAEAELDRGATFFFTLGSPEKNSINESEASIVEETIDAA
jgi:signal transduction histidine kinase